MKLNVRPLTLGILVAVLLVALRVGDIWRQTGTAHAQRLVQQQEAAPAVTPDVQPEAPTPSAAAAAAMPTTDDVTQLTASEIQVLQQLVLRRAEIEKRAADLDRREAMLKAAEERIDTKIQEIKKLQGGVEQAIRRFDEQEEQRRMSLVRIYESMKPAEAARIFEQMELTNLVELVERMGTRKVAPILATMNPVRAKQVTAELSKRRKPGESGGTPGATPEG